MRKIGITAAAAISGRGINKGPAGDLKSAISWLEEEGAWAAPLSQEANEELEQLRQAHRSFRHLDRSVLMAMYTAAQAVRAANWSSQYDFGIQIGSSRGATGLWEEAHKKHLRGEALAPITSPYSTLGNLSTNVARYLGQSGWLAEQSITCSTALHAMVQGIAFMQSNLVERFLVGGTEAALTDFTFRQMEALRVTPNAQSGLSFPCRPFAYSKETGMVLGEGAACFCLEREAENPLAWVLGFGYAREQVDSATGINKDGMGYQKAMSMALAGIELNELDLILAHAPGTRQGDSAEYQAIRTVFADKMPAVYSNKWQIGHCFGASGALNIFDAIAILKGEADLTWPYALEYDLPPIPGDLSTVNHILVNATGFGGNVVSILLGKK